MRTAAGLVLIVACSDYEFAKFDDANAGARDTGTPDPGTGTSDGSPRCEEVAPEGQAVSQDEACAAEPEVGTFDPVVEWRWSDNPIHATFEQVMVAPVVANLTDDNGDGITDEHDVPDVVFTVFSPSTGYRSPGGLVAVSGADGTTLWSTVDLGGGVQPYGCGGVGIADVDGTGPSIFVMTTAGMARLTAEGELLWATEPAEDPHPYGYIWPAFADLDGDGTSEIAAGSTVLNADGSIRWTGAGGTSGFSFFADLDQDGDAELIVGRTVYNADGSILWDEGANGKSAVADLDLDGDPEIVTVVRDVGVSARHHDGTLMWEIGLDDLGGGPPTIADFDGDGAAEIGLASEYWYRVLEGIDGTERWRTAVQDNSSKVTGSSVFDFEGDGAAEVVYADEETLWVFDGNTGSVELALGEHSSGTLFEYPLVVDVDADGSAEIVAIANDYSSHSDSTGLAVIGDADSSWSAGRPIWNQHAYSISNIADDARVPASPLPNWRNWNNFRAGNSETRVGLDLPDLLVGDPEVCLDECESTGEVLVWIPVQNGGLAEAEEVFVSLYAVDGEARTLVHTDVVARVEAGTETFLAPLRVTEEDFGPGGLLIVVDDDGETADRIEECKEANNSTLLPRFPC